MPKNRRTEDMQCLLWFYVRCKWSHRQQAADSLQNIEVEWILRRVTGIVVIILIISVECCALHNQFPYPANMMKFCLVAFSIIAYLLERTIHQFPSNHNETFRARRI